MLRADWTVPYPDDLNEVRVPAVLHVLTHVEHEWDAFPWYLAQRLVGLLEAPEACFDYFHVTAFFLARAAMLALSGGVLHRADLFGALYRYRVQAGGIYRTHLLHYLRLFLSRQNFAQLPVCVADSFEALHSEDMAERNRGLVQRVVRFAEADYLKTLNFISLATEMEEMVCGQNVAFWVSGGRMPAPVMVRVHTRRHEYGHDWMPTRDEAKAAYREDRPVRAIAVRVQRELGLVANAERGMLNAEVKTGDRGRSEESGPVYAADYSPLRRGGPVYAAEDSRLPPSRKATADVTTDDRGRFDGVQGRSRGRAGLRVVGDYRVIHMPGRRPINLGRKHKTRAVLGFIHRALKKADKPEFYVEEMREAFNAQFDDDAAGKRWVSDRFREDLFKGRERDFDALFEVVERAAGLYRLKVWEWLAMVGAGAAGIMGEDAGIGEVVQWVAGEMGMWV